MNVIEGKQVIQIMSRCTDGGVWVGEQMNTEQQKRRRENTGTTDEQEDQRTSHSHVSQAPGTVDKGGEQQTSSQEGMEGREVDNATLGEEREEEGKREEEDEEKRVEGRGREEGEEKEEANERELGKERELGEEREKGKEREIGKEREEGEGERQQGDGENRAAKEGENEKQSGPLAQKMDISETPWSNIVSTTSLTSPSYPGPSGLGAGENGVHNTNSLLTLTEDGSFLGSGSPLTVDKAAAIQHLHRLALQYDTDRMSISGSEGSTNLRLSLSSSKTNTQVMWCSPIMSICNLLLFRAVCAVSTDSSEQRFIQSDSLSGGDDTSQRGQ